MTTTEPIATAWTATPAHPSRPDDMHRRWPEQAWKGAALLMPTLAFWAPVVHYGLDFVGWAFLGVAAYFPAVLRRVALSPRRRRWALGVAAAGLAGEAALLLTINDHELGLQSALFCAIPIAYVAAWGIARRTDARWWKTGLPLAALIVVIPVRAAALAWIASGHLLMASMWLCWPGIVTLGCLVCWAIETRGGRPPAGDHH